METPQPYVSLSHHLVTNNTGPSVRREWRWRKMKWYCSLVTHTSSLISLPHDQPVMASVWVGSGKHLSCWWAYCMSVCSCCRLRGYTRSLMFYKCWHLFAIEMCRSTTEVNVWTVQVWKEERIHFPTCKPSRWQVHCSRCWSWWNTCQMFMLTCYRFL